MIAKDVSDLSLLLDGLNALDDGIAVFDRQLNLVGANRRAIELLQFPDSLGEPGTPLAEMFRYNAARGEYGDGDVETLVAERVAQAREMKCHRFRRLRPDGTLLEISGAPLGNGRGFSCIFRDITEIEQSREELAKHRDLLAAEVRVRTAALENALSRANSAAKAKSRFLANISHQLRTPLHAILSFSRLATARAGVDVSERLQRYGQRIESSAQRLAELVDDLIELAELETGAAPPKRAACDLTRLVRDTLAEQGVMFERRDIDLQLRIDAPPTAYCDAEQIGQVMRHLLNNALHHAPERSTVSVTVHPSRLDRLTPAVAVSISDQGCGLSPDQFERVFEDFESGVPDGAGCRGLGLAICHKILLAHGGRITAANNSRGGARFTFFLPVRAPRTHARNRLREAGTQPERV